MANEKGVCKKVYVNEDVTETRSAGPEVTRLEFRFANGNVHSVINGQFPEAVENCFKWFGRSEKLGNFYAGAKGDADVAEEMFLSGSERLGLGDWVKAGEAAGPRITQLVAAVAAVLLSKGEIVDAEREATIAEKLKDKDLRESTKADLEVQAQLTRIQAEAAAERAAKALEAAGATPPTEGEGIGSTF